MGLQRLLPTSGLQPLPCWPGSSSLPDGRGLGKAAACSVAETLLAPRHAPWAHPKCEDPGEDFRLACKSTALPLNLLDSRTGGFAPSPSDGLICFPLSIWDAVLSQMGLCPHQRPRGKWDTEPCRVPGEAALRSPTPRF